MKSYAKLLIVTVLYSIAFQSYGQTPSLKFDQIGVREGLADASVTSIIQDQRDFLWFGTYQGVSRFDGYEFTNFQFDEKASNSLHDNVISCLMEDRFGKIWIGTFNRGVSVFDPILESFEFMNGDRSDTTKLPHESITCLFEDSEGMIWIGTENGLSVISADRQSVKKYYDTDDPRTINHKAIFDIKEDEQKGIWIASGEHEICRYDKNEKTFKTVVYSELNKENLSDNLQKKMVIIDDEMWVTSNKGGLSRLDLNTLEYKTYQPDGTSAAPSTWKIWDILAHDGQLWLATDGAGLDIFDIQSEQFTNYQNSRTDQSSLSSNALWTMLKDIQGNIWIGTYQGGINKLDIQNNYFQLVTNEPMAKHDLTDKPILSLCKSPNDGLWIGTDWGGLQHRSQAGSIKQFNWQMDGSGLSTNVVKSLAYDKNGGLLIGTFNYGLSTYDTVNQVFEHYQKIDGDDSSLVNNNVWTIYTDSKGISWIGTLGGGIVIFDPDQKRFQCPDIEYLNGEQYLVYSIFEDSQSNLWFSTDNGILFYNRRIDDWDTFLVSDRTGFQNHQLNYVKSIIEDQFQHLWIATSGGLVKYEPQGENYFLVDEVNDQIDIPILDMINDDYGNLILVTKTSVLQYDLLKEKANIYYVKDNAFTTGAIIKDELGKIVLGGLNGLTIFDPKALRKNRFKPRVYLSELEVLNENQKPNHSNSILDTAVAFSHRIKVDYDQSVISLKYTALNFSEPEQNRFAYQLIGFDEDWNYVKNRRMVTYTNLDPGSYTFKVKACNNHGVWNEEGSELDIEVLPPYWKVWWFQALIVIAIVTLIYVILKMRIDQIKRDFENKSLKVEHELINLKNAHLNKKLSSTSDDLTNITMNYLHSNQKMLQIRKKIEENSIGLEPSDKQRFTRIIKEIDKEVRDHDYWDKFEHQFNKSHGNFLERFKLKNPDLSKRELRICAYLRMGLHNHEISTLMNVTVRTIETSRYRIRKKIGLEERQSFTKMILRF